MQEIDALAEIYGENQFSYEFNEKNNEISGHFIAFNKLIDYESIIVTGNNHNINIFHLPPIYLSFTIHSNDVENTPSISLSCNWMPNRSLKIINSKLNQIIKENEESRLWLCCEYLEKEAVKSLFRIDESGTKININLDDLHPLEEESQIDDYLELLTNYNAERDQSIFEKSIVDCEVCMTSLRGVECVKLMTCTHIACADCIMNHFNARLNMGFSNLSCVVCDERIEYHEVRRVMDSQTFERWDTLLLKDFMKSLGEQRACNRCQTLNIADPADGFGTCSHCGLTFCIDCNETFNGPKCCHNKTPENYRLNVERRGYKNRANGAAKDIAIRPVAPTDYSLFAPESRKAANRLSKSNRCPKCFLLFEKNGGCNVMFCPLCQKYFCFLCRSGLDLYKYEHFKNGKCVLYGEGKK